MSYGYEPDDPRQRYPAGPYEQPYQQPYQQQMQQQQLQQQQQQYNQQQRQYNQQQRSHAAAVWARVIIGLTGAIAFIFALHIVFSLAGANENNGVVRFVYVLSKVFVLGFGDVFTPNDAVIGLVLNYGLAAVIYLVIGQWVARLLRR